MERIKLLYSDNNIYVPDIYIQINKDNGSIYKKIETIEEEENISENNTDEEINFITLIDNIFSLNKVQKIYESIIEEANKLETSRIKKAHTYSFKIMDAIIETNNINAILKEDIIKNILTSHQYIRETFKISNRYFYFKILEMYDGFINQFLILDTHIIGPILFEELLSGYLNYYIEKFALQIKNTKYIPYQRIIEYKKFFNLEKKNNDYYIIINGNRYKISEISKHNMLLNKHNLVTFGYAVLKKLGKEYIVNRQIKDIKFEKIQFYDIHLNKIFAIYCNDLSEINRIRILSYLFPQTYNYNEYKSELYINNLNYYYTIDETQYMFNK